MKTTVLVIDDNKEWADEVTASLMSNETLNVVATAYDGEQGLRAFNALKPDVVILDLVCPNATATRF